MEEKRGVFFSIDALIAIGILFIIILIAYPIVKISQQETEIHYDVIKAFSSIKVGDTNNSYLKNLIASGVINDTNKSLLEQIGEFYVTDINKAKMLASELLKDLNTTTRNIGIWYGSTLIASINSTSYEDAKNVETARVIISGIKEGENVTGFSARAFLANSQQTRYTYFGGYVGDGNITERIEYQGNISSATMELTINKDFTLYVNNVSAGNYSKSDDDFTPKTYAIPTANFTSGVNLIDIKGDNLHIAGGFIKITFEDGAYTSPTKYYFPGINGLINIYDGFYIPNTLNSLEVYLHLNSNYSTFLTIGNITVFKNSTQGEKTITIINSTLAGLLNYNNLIKKTVPVRLGLENASYITTGGVISTDVVSVEDVSGSMAGTKITNAKLANNALIDGLLNKTGNRVALVAYNATAEENVANNLSNNSVSLKNKVNSWAAGGSTCICCGINKGVVKVLNNNLLVYYSFENNLLDKSGNLNHGTAIGNPYYASGEVGSSLHFDGDDAVNISDIITSEEGSISFWMNATSFTNKTMFDASSSTRYFFIDINSSGRLRFWLEDNANAAFQNATYDLSLAAPNQWHHVVAAWKYNDRPATKLYFDGNLVGIDNKVSGRVPNLISANIGKALSSSTTKWAFNGTIDEFRIYSKGLNLAQVQRLFNNQQTCGNDLVEINEECDDGNLNNTDGCSSTCAKENILKSMVVLSDGEATLPKCYEQDTGNVTLDAIKAACTAKQKYNVTVNAVGFGGDADNVTMQQIAACGGGNYYFGDVNQIVNIYNQIAQSLINASYKEQTVQASGYLTTRLYPDSYIKFDYEQPNITYGLSITTEKKFDDTFSGTLDLPPNSTILESRVTSYSGPRWTDKAIINNITTYNLTNYGTNYIELGDPYVIYIPNNLIGKGNNVTVTTGTSNLNSSSGSASNKIIFTVLKNVTGYSPISANVDGCIWKIEFEDYTNITARLPSSYTGSDNCFYTEGLTQYDNNDASENAVYKLLQLLDLNSNNKVDVKFSEQDLQIELSEIFGIPYTWSTEVQVRVWY